MKIPVYLSILAVAFLTGCGNDSNKPAQTSGSPLDTRGDYLSTLAKGQISAVKTVDTVSLNQAIQMVNDDNQTASYRIEADEIAVYNGSKLLPGTLTWNSDNTSAVLTTPDVLPSQANLTFSVKLHWEKLNGSTWAPLLNTESTEVAS